MRGLDCRGARRKKLDELVDPTAREAYYAIGEELSYYPLGMLPDEAIEAYREMPGNLDERPRSIVCTLHMWALLCAHDMLSLRAPRSLEAVEMGMARR